MIGHEEAAKHYQKATAGYTSSGIKRKGARKRPLPALSSIVDPSVMLSSVDLGIREISLERVVGTYYQTRGYAFADEFIPKYDTRSEIYYKWTNLCMAQLEEGIREPILVYEYLNKYYVQEGNKRVSVLKYFEAVSIPAKVVRLIPPYNEEDPENVIYYSFMDFFAKTDYEDIWFSYAGGFSELIELMDRFIEKESYKDYLRKYYGLFKRIYKSSLEDKYTLSDNVTTGDIFLAYIKLFGENAIDEDNLIKRMSEVISQFVAEGVVEVDDDIESHFLNGQIFNFKKTKVAFVFAHKVDHDGWNKDHFRGYEAMLRSFGNQMVIDYFEDVLGSKSIQGTLQKIAEGYDVIFLVENDLAERAMKCAVDFPKTIFLVSGWMTSSYLLPTYYGKTYQANYLLGLYAALACKKDKVGYVSREMGQKIYLSLKAFEAGYRSLRPYGEVIYAKEEENLSDEIELWASYRTQAKHATEGTVNTYLVRRDQIKYEAYTFWQWKKFYEQIFDRLLDGSFHRLWSSHRETNDILYFNWGIGTGVIGIEMVSMLPNEGASMVFNNIKEDIIEGRIELSYLWDVTDYEDWCNKYRQ